MKKFVISGIPLCETITGIARYMYEVLIRLDELMCGRNFELIICYPQERQFVNYNFKNIKLVPLKKGNKKWLPQIVVPYAKRKKAVICDMADGYCLQKGSIIKLDDVRPGVTKFDSIKMRLHFKVLIRSIKKNAKLIITVSGSQKKEIQKMISGKEIKVFPSGWEHLKRFKFDDSIFEHFTVIRKGEYYYSIGSIAKHKNYRWIYEMAKRNPSCQFVVAGNEDLEKWGTDISGVHLKNVIFVGYVSDDENKSLYANCKAVLHPAYYEGFGLPPLEAVSMGKNIAVSNISEFREVYGDNISYFEPDDYTFDLASIKAIPQKVRKEILKKYSWDKTAYMWMNLLNEFGEK